MNEEVGYTIYSKKFCPWCDKAKIMLHVEGKDFTVVDCTDSDEPRQHLLDEGKNTVPQIFKGDDYVGGFEQLFNMKHSIGL